MEMWRGGCKDECVVSGWMDGRVGGWMDFLCVSILENFTMATLSPW